MLDKHEVFWMACAQRLGYVGRTAKTLLADMEKKHPELKS
jgi:hypothetical protein